MRRAIAAAAAVLAAAGCRKEPEPSTAPQTTVYEWAQQSPDRRFELRQRRDAAGCRVEATVKPDDRVLWTSQTCLPVPSGLAFLSPNGERVLVLDLFPSSQMAQGPDWTHVPLLSCWSRGAVVRQYSGGEILSASRVTDMRKVLSWVRGDSFEEAHAAARASADGSQVTVDLVDGRSLTLGFEGSALAEPPSMPPPAPAPERAGDATPQPDQPAASAQAARAPDPLAADERGLYRWEDDQGELHFGVGSQVPARFRKRAQPVSATVGVMPVDSPAPQQQPARPAAGSPAAVTPAGAPQGAPPAPPAPRRLGEGDSRPAE
jgi:hypothetical protein